MKVDFLTNRHGLILAAVLLIVLTLACAKQDEPFRVGDRATPTSTPTDAEKAQVAAAIAAVRTSTPVPVPTSVPTPTPVQALSPTPVPSGQSEPSSADTSSPTVTPETTAQAISLVQPTRTPEPLPEDYDRTALGPPKHELMKFAEWDENRIKLSNWIAGYIVAHGLDHPVRIIETNPDDYKDGLPHGDIDIVLEADPAWAQPYADAGVLVVLGPLSSASPDTVVAVNASVWQRAPEVGKFLEEYALDGDSLTADAGKFKTGRIPITEKVLGLSYMKDSQATWSTWIDAATTEVITAAIADGTFTLCRSFETRTALNSPIRVCRDDPTVATCERCQ